MWYRLKTEPKEELIMQNVIRQTVSEDVCERCMVIKREKLYHKQGVYHVYEELVFPCMVIVASENPVLLTEQLKKIPYYEKKFEFEDYILEPISEQEENFLRSVATGKNQEVIPLSLVEVDTEGVIVTCSGVLAPYLEQIIKKRIRERYVIIRIPLIDREWTMLMGICLSKDREAN